MDTSRPSLPPKIFVADKIRPTELTHRLVAHGCQFIECSLFVLLFSIEVFSLSRACSFARIVLYKVSMRFLSRTFYYKVVDTLFAFGWISPRPVAVA